MTWDSSSGMAMCQALYVFPRKRMSSDGIFGWGWLNEMPSNSACKHERSCQALLSASQTSAREGCRICLCSSELCVD